MLTYGGTYPSLAVINSTARREKWLVKLPQKAKHETNNVRAKELGNLLPANKVVAVP
jgi:hypothetical protein